jgi:hypothetical protein
MCLRGPGGRGLRLARASWLLGVSVPELRAIEAGNRWPDFERSDRICKLFGWPQAFVGESGQVAYKWVSEFDDLGSRIVSALGKPGARELLGVLTRSDADRAALIGRLHLREEWRGSPSSSWTSRPTPTTSRGCRSSRLSDGRFDSRLTHRLGIGVSAGAPSDLLELP